MKPSPIFSELRPGSDEFFTYYNTYISKVPDGDIMELLEAQPAELRGFFDSLTEEQTQAVHPPYTWTIRQVAGHLIDGERIFADRLHRFAFGDKQAQPGMDQNIYVDNADYANVTTRALVEELLACRQANVLMLKRVPARAWTNRGVASGHEVTVRALAWMLCGHVIHHLQILKQRVKDL